MSTKEVINSQRIEEYIIKSIKPIWYNNKLRLIGGVRMYPYKHFSYNVPNTDISIITSLVRGDTWYGDVVVRNNYILHNYIKVLNGKCLYVGSKYYD